MPKGPRGEKRPADVIGAAVMVGRIATGEIEDSKTEKNPHAVALGKLGGSKGGKARATNLTDAARKRAARLAARARWADSDNSKPSGHLSPNQQRPNRKKKP